MAQKTLLVSDLDDTLLGDDAALERFASYYEARRSDLSLVYATGRFADSVVENINTSPLPGPLAIIGGVGSEMLSFPEGRPFESWVARMSENWSMAKLRAALEDEPDLVPQPESAQSEFKLSYYLEGADEKRLQALERRIHATGIRARVVYSSSRDLDILPEGVDKGSAAEHAAGALGFARSEVIVAGNSANDAALFGRSFRGIVVGNAHAELKELARLPDVYLASKGYADAVVEGLEHWRHTGASS